jgi:hypothetical protein
MASRKGVVHQPAVWAVACNSSPLKKKGTFQSIIQRHVDEVLYGDKRFQSHFS